MFTTLFPADCRLCGAPLIKISRLPVCESCLIAIHPINRATCVVCGERIRSSYTLSANGSDEPRCELCSRFEPPFVRAAAYGSYEGGLRELIHLLKYEGVRPAANVLGRMLAEAVEILAPSFGDTPPLLLPVPLHREKFRQRGFNQAELIAHAALKLKPAKGRLALKTNILTRQRATQSQIGFTRHQRRENLRGAFAVAKSAAIAGREILLVDDVFTTGTTVSECARILLQNGAEKVWVATVARTLKMDDHHAQIEDADRTSLAATVGG